MIVASASLNCFIFRRIPSFRVERPNLYFPSGLRIITPSNPLANTSRSYCESSSILLISTGIRGMIFTCSCSRM
ncbi:hypothetical protein AR158_C660L [Paramecium bursaria Chlorella virus AR158]|uniref:hypothetical protein n=1 Tax=Paramecium bursaria Chlorella virus AR158 TaxID=380598 RepID=UPI00015AA827|nr:hypothetical protein AR158_C660L [Paramecium bursaria Chlorella virus AR158]ABU44205.1 hypothetical protein AR158_C660L [Paramecium bursaria Chlorella virus AR158]